MKIYSALKNFLFLDIETVREYPDYETFLKHRSGEHWEKVSARHMKDENLTPAAAYVNKASLYVEYGKVISVCFGSFTATEENPFAYRIGAVSNEDEKALLLRVKDYLDKVYAKEPDTVICGHNVKEFDIPYLIKRMIKYEIKLPTIFINYLSAKTWDTKATDTLYDWRMAGNRFMGLDSIAEFLGFESSKQGEVKGANLGEYYWTTTDSPEIRAEKINTYCKADVRVVMDLAKRFYAVL
jgi:predicted PolB exonuclease-like 3'-5' exonuclease